MKTKTDIVKDWQPWHTGTPINQFSWYILMTNFTNYRDLFASNFLWKFWKPDKLCRLYPPKTLLSLILSGQLRGHYGDEPVECGENQSGIFLGEMPGIKEKNEHWWLDPAHISHPRGGCAWWLHSRRNSVASFFSIVVCRILNEQKIWKNYWIGAFYTKYRRVREHDQTFKKYLRRARAMIVDMQIATLFIVGFINKYQEEPYCWSQTIPWYQHRSKQDCM